MTAVAPWAAGLVVTVAAVGGMAVLRSGDDASRPDRQEVAAYHDALRPLVVEWGRIEVQGMRPAISDLRTGEGVPPETVAGEARAWRASLERIRASMRALPVPEGLESAADLFDEAAAHYLEATVAFERAAEATGAGREQGIDEGIEAARAGARRYNEASMMLQGARVRAGLEKSPDFPDQPAA